MLEQYRKCHSPTHHIEQPVNDFVWLHTVSRPVKVQQFAGAYLFRSLLDKLEIGMMWKKTS
jgi:hypothetical protein